MLFLSGTEELGPLLSAAGEPMAVMASLKPIRRMPR